MKRIIDSCHGCSREVNLMVEEDEELGQKADCIKQAVEEPNAHRRSDKGLRLQNIKRCIFKYWQLKIVQILLGVYITVMTFTPIGTFGKHGGFVTTSVGLIIDPSPERTEQGLILSNGVERAVIAANNFQMFCLSISRFGAFSMYPALALIFITKYKFTLSFLESTPFSMYFFRDMHDVHIYCGWVIAIDSILHTVFHLARWANQGNIRLLFHHFSGVSGFIVVLSAFLVCFPMMFKCVKTKLNFEIRKYLHYFFIVFALGMMFHTTPTSIPNGGFSLYVFSFLIAYYFFDALLVYLFMTEKVETTVFDVIPSGVQLTMKVSERFQKPVHQGGFCYVCFPWVSKSEWHAYSLFENPSKPEERQIFLLKTGDWTSRVHKLLQQRDTVRPVWVQGPFFSPYSYATHFDNQIMIAGGIGITPALSVIRAYKDSRRTNLVWSVKDPAMLEFFLERAYLDHKGWNLIFYTGKTPLVQTILDSVRGTNVCIIHGRPNISAVILNIIYGIESGIGKPERYLPSQKAIATERLIEKCKELEEVPGLSNSDKLKELAFLASQLGFLFTDIVRHLQHEGLLKYTLEYQDSGDLEPLYPRQRTCSSSQRGSKTSSVPPTRTSSPSKCQRLIYSCEDEDTFSLEDNCSGSSSSSMVESMMKEVTLTFQPWVANEWAGGFVKRMDPELLERWGILYCGGANGLEGDLVKTAEKFDLGLHCESCAW